VKPEAAALLDKARRSLADAERILLIEADAVAAREAYMAAFHAAQALLFERTGRVPKTHSGVHAAFGQLTIQELGLSRDLGRFLADAYTQKQIADYATDRTVDKAKAKQTIAAAALLLATVEDVIA